MRRFLRYLVGAKNLLGCVLALVGLGLHLFGLFGPFWPLVVASLYAAGALLGPRPRLRLAGDLFDPGLVRRSLDHAYQMTHGRLPVDVQTQVARIRQQVLELLPHTADFPIGSQDLFVLQQTAVDYLPTALDAYLALPHRYATERVVQDGRTSLAVLKEELALLEGTTAGIAEAVHRRDSDRLLAHRSFLEVRFGHGGGGLELPGPPGAANTSPPPGVGEAR